MRLKSVSEYNRPCRFTLQTVKGARNNICQTLYFNFKLLAALRNDKEFDTNDLENNYRFVFIKKKQASAILLHIYDDIRDIKFITLYSIACVSRCHDRYKNHALIFNK